MYILRILANLVNSVTPLKANFMHALSGKKGEINL